jgi:hypothetical protein
MRRKAIIAALAAVLAITLSGCNMSFGLGNYNFRKIHIDTQNCSGCFTIEKWYNCESGIDVKTEEAGYMHFAEGMYILIEDECPFCKEEHNAD